MGEDNDTTGTEIAKYGFWGLLIAGVGYGGYRVINYFSKPSMPDDVRALVLEIQEKVMAQDVRDNQMIADGGATVGDYAFDDTLQDDIDQEWAELIALIDTYPEQSEIWGAVTDQFIKLIQTAGIFFLIGGSLITTRIAFQQVMGFRTWYQGQRLKKVQLRPAYNQIPPPKPMDPGSGGISPLKPGPPPPATCPTCHVIFDSPQDLANHIASGVHPVSTDAVTLEGAQAYFNTAPAPLKAAVYAQAAEWGVAQNLAQYWPSIAATTMLYILAAVAIATTAGVSSPVVPLVYENAFAGSSALSLNTIGRILQYA